jgi:hypothetical protein
MHVRGFFAVSMTAIFIGRVAPGRALPGRALSFRQLYDLLVDCVSGRGNWPVRMLEGHQGHLESDAQEAGGLGVKPVALQVVPDRHG